jgi:hypothetical protein
MRKTLTLDEDVVQLLECVRQKRRASLKEVVNEALRQGLVGISTPAVPQPRYETRSVNAGKCLVDNLDNIAEVLAVAEGEDFK